MTTQMKVALIPNDFSMDLESVFQLCSQEKVKYIELGFMWDKSLLDLNDQELIRVQDLLKKYNLKVASIQTQIMKVMPPKSMLERKGSKNMHFDYEYNISLIDHAIELAVKFDAKYIVTYSYFRHGSKFTVQNWQNLIKDYESFLPKLKAKNKAVVIECEPDTYVKNVADYLRLFHHFESPYIQANFDMGNLFGGQKDFTRADFEQISQYVPYFHVKDRRQRLFGRVGAVFGEGMIPWRKVLPWFAEKGFDGFLSVEPHVHGSDRFELGRQCVKNLQKLLTELKIPFE